MRMRMSLAVLLVAIGMLAGYALRSSPVGAQESSGYLTFTQGEVVTLSVDFSPSTITCRVSQIQHGFVACAPDEQQQRDGQREQWINTRYIQKITLRPRPF